MPVKFKLKEKHIQFCRAVASEMQKVDAYKKYLAKKNMKPGVMSACASNLCKKPQIQDLIEKFRKEREAQIIKAQVKIMPQEFTLDILSQEQLDSYHCAIIQGMIMVEEIIPIYEISYDDNGRANKRFVSFKSVKRPPNIREKQTSIDALYKRRGSYAASRSLVAIAEVENMDNEAPRFVLLSNGEKIAL